MLIAPNPIIVWSLVVGAVLYVATWAAVMCASVRKDRERSWAKRVLALATGMAGASSGGDDNGLAALVRLAPISASLHVLRGSSPFVVREAVARAVVARIGIATLRRDLLVPRIGIGRWRRIAALQLLTLHDRAAAWDDLEVAVVDSSREVAAVAVTLAGELSDVRAASILIVALRAGRFPRSQVAAALDLFPMNIGHLVVTLLDDRDAALRYWGAVLMYRYPRHRALSVHLRDLAQDSDPLVRKAALDTTAAVGGADGMAIARSCLSDAVAFVRGHAAQALATIGGSGAAASIASLLADADWQVRFAAKQSLVRLGPVPASALLPFLHHADEGARNGAAEVLQDVGEFERLLLREVDGVADPVRHRTLRLLASAGGAEMRQAIVARLRPSARRSGETILGGLAVVVTS